MLLEAAVRFSATHFGNGILRKLEVHSQGMTFENFFRPSRVYVRFSSRKEIANYVYIGSTSQTICQRERTRFRKFQQVQQDKLVSAELAVRFWALKDNFWGWCIVPAGPSISQDQLMGTERAMIQMLHPKLKYPFVSTWLSPQIGFKKPANVGSNRDAGLKRIYRKVRRRLLGVGKLPNCMYSLFHQSSVPLQGTNLAAYQ